uniref:Uncharacterized protein n=1 Tax=Rhipicephalus zambeziensis TaxID=60191 RepID=A0A224YKJ0_9ACAR
MSAVCDEGGRGGKGHRKEKNESIDERETCFSLSLNLRCEAKRKAKEHLLSVKRMAEARRVLCSFLAFRGYVGWLGCCHVDVADGKTPARVDAASASAFLLAGFATRTLSSPATHLTSQ